MSEILQLGTLQLLQAYRSKALSPVEVVRTFITRI
jgi:hypothetical protein